MWHGRYTCTGDLQLKVIDFVSRNAGKYIISREYASREHLQCYIEYPKAKKTWDNTFRSSFKELDRRDKYFVEDAGRTKIYVCKFEGRVTVEEVLERQSVGLLSYRGFTPEEIQEFNKIYWDDFALNSEKQKANKIEIILEPSPETKSEKTKKPRPPTFMRQCRNELEDEYPNIVWKHKHRKLVFMKVMDNLGMQCKNLDKFIIIRMVNGVLNSLIKNRKEWHEYWYQECFNDQLYLDGVVEIDDDDKVDEEYEKFTAYLEQIKKENEEEELKTINAAKLAYFGKK